jgi:hypothetical protein
MLTRPLRRPKNRWEGNIINDIKKLYIKNWIICIQDRNKWKLYVERPKRLKNEALAPKEEEEKEVYVNLRGSKKQNFQPKTQKQILCKELKLVHKISIM